MRESLIRQKGFLCHSEHFQIIKSNDLLYYYNINFLKWSPTLAIFTLSPSSHSSLYPSILILLILLLPKIPMISLLVLPVEGSLCFLFYSSASLLRRLIQLPSYYLIVIFVILAVVVLPSIQPLTFLLGSPFPFWRILHRCGVLAGGKWLLPMMKAEGTESFFIFSQHMIYCCMQGSANEASSPETLNLDQIKM